MKFTEQGSVSVEAAAVREGTEIVVKDTGIGISSHDVERIWDRFFKVDRVRSRSEVGTGLGLAIVKELVELHQGTVTVKSEVNKGTAFTIWFPGEKK